MNMVEVMRTCAQEVGGQFSEYDQHKSIIVIPLAQGRFQTIIGRFKENYHQPRQMIEISSKICQYKDSLNLVEILEENSNFNYSKFTIEDNYLKIQATTIVEVANSEIVKEMILEVAEAADHWEQRITGIDVH